MAVRFLRYALPCMICFGLANPASLFAQGTPLTIGPLTVTVPAGWTGQTDTDPARFFSPESTPQQYFSLEFRNPQTTTDDVFAHHNMVVNNLSGLKESGTQSQRGILGQFIWTRIVIRRPQSQSETLILYSAKVGSLYVLMDVDATNADLVAKDLPAVEAMIRFAVLSNTPGAPASSGSVLSAPTSAAPPSGGGTYAPQGPIPTGPASLSQYVYAVPPGWMPAQYSDGIVLTSPASATGERCQISMWPMRPTAGNPGSDASKAFREVFKAYEEEPGQRRQPGTDDLHSRQVGSRVGLLDRQTRNWHARAVSNSDRIGHGSKLEWNRGGCLNSFQSSSRKHLPRRTRVRRVAQVFLQPELQKLGPNGSGCIHESNVGRSMDQCHWNGLGPVYVRCQWMLRRRLWRANLQPSGFTVVLTASPYDGNPPQQSPPSQPLPWTGNSGTTRAPAVPATAQNAGRPAPNPPAGAQNEPSWPQAF